MLDNPKLLKVSIIGSPNVGKSSLLNYMVKYKNSFVSPKPHTTRDNILGVTNLEETQLIFVDTPGYIKSGVGIWAGYLIQSVREAMSEVGVNLVLVDATRPNCYGTDAILNATASDPKTIIALNKIDVVSRPRLYSIIKKIAEFGYEDIVYLISAKSGTGVQDLLKALSSRATPEAWLYHGNEDVKLKNERYASECVREKAFYVLQREIPFQIWTTASQWSFSKKEWQVSVDIVVTKPSHKKIVIGRNAEMLKSIGIAARTELESLWGPGKLFLNVREDTSWLKHPDYIAAVCKGYTLPIEE